MLEYEEIQDKADELGAEWFEYSLGVLMFRDQFGLYNYIDWDWDSWSEPLDYGMRQKNFQEFRISLGIL